MVFLTFLWHMHQPWYLDPEKGIFLLPWVRLHGTKDYLDMARLIEEFPKIRAVINCAPCLLEQIELYEKGTQDFHQALCAKPAESLTPAEISALMEIGFSGLAQRMIDPYPRYAQLHNKGSRKQPWTSQELTDLQVWSNLSWMDPRWRRENPFVKHLFQKSSHFTQEEKKQLLAVQLELLSQVIPTYKALQDKDQMEISSSPWAHPILPLLFDGDIARQTNPGMPLPEETFRFPEDAAWHLQEAAQSYHNRFGASPRGLWPSEGSVSESVLPLVAQAGFKWLAADEEILWKSLQGPVRSRSILYQPFRFQLQDKELSIVFRDHVLSDLIGFVYSGWPAPRAVADFISRLKNIEASVAQGVEPFVLVALDGENAWESYPGDGEPFLRGLYEAISGESWIECQTISQHLASHPPKTTLAHLSPGSWIRGEFSTWIGHEPQNKAWGELLRARRLLGPSQSRHIAIAQGSDWFWWLGPEHSSTQDPIFDQLFRKQLVATYRQAQKSPPPTLEEGLKPVSSVTPVMAEPTQWVSPQIDGQVTSYFEWLHAGELDLTYTGSAMARAKPIFHRLWWGCDEHQGYLRLDPEEDLRELKVQVILKTSGCHLALGLELGHARISGMMNDGRSLDPSLFKAAAGKIVELSFPLQIFGWALGKIFTMAISVEQEGLVLERYPEHGQLSLHLPAPKESSKFWSA